MRGKNDLQGYCDPNAHHQPPVVAPVNPETINHPLMQLFATVGQAKYFEPNAIGCKIWSNEEIINYNFYVWTLAFYVGLQNSHLSNIPCLKYWVIDAKQMKTWSF